MIGERQTFAEAMMLMDTPNYVASAEAVGPTQVYRLSNATYMRLLQSNSRLTFALLGKLCVRLHQRVNEIETLSLKNATHRVVRYLLTQLVRLQTVDSQFELPMAKQLIAGHLSIQPETFSRIIRRLIDEKSSPRTVARSPFSIACAWNSSNDYTAHLPVLPTSQPDTRNRMSPVRHAPASRGRKGQRAPVAALHLVLCRLDDLLHRHVLLAAPRHRLNPQS
nr:hypothetical protein GCM10020185_71370 [Pseudomonas brassicacearum subsp. brassicacearum]